MKMDKEQAFVELMDAAQAYYEATQDVGQSVKQGLFNISQARYSYPRPLGQAQYHAEMRALTRVQAAKGSRTPEFQIVSSLPVVSEQLSQSPSDAAHGRHSEDGASSAGPGMSSNQPQDQTSDSGSDIDALLDDGEGDYSDPLKWFGLLVPQPLRRAQQDFASGLVSVVKLAAAKQRLQRALDTAQQLKLDLSVT